MSDHDISPMYLPSCMYASEPSSNSSEYEGSVNRDTIHMKVQNQEEQYAQATSCAPIGNSSSYMYYQQRNPPAYADAVYQSDGCLYPNQQSMPVYTNMKCARHTDGVRRTNGVQKRKRARTAFTTNQLEYLEQQYNISRYIERGARVSLSNKLNVKERIVKIWFQNRRMKDKRVGTENSLEDSGQCPTQPSAIPQGPFVQSVPTYNILPQAINNGGIRNYDNYMYEPGPGPSVHFAVAPVMADPQVQIPNASPTAIEAMPLNRQQDMPPAVVRELGPTVFSDFTQYYDAYNAQ